MAKKYTLTEIRERVLPVAKKHGVERVFLFGSYATGTATEYSDLDFRIDRGKIKGLLSLGAFHSDLQKVFSIPVDVITTDGADPAFLKMTMNEEVLLFESDL